MSLDWMVGSENAARAKTFRNRYIHMKGVRWEGKYPTGSGSGVGVEYSGSISGVVTVLGDPAIQTVRAYRRSDGALVASTRSNPDGTYTLEGLNPEETHYVVALHGLLEYNAVVADNIVPEEGQ